MEIKRDAFKAYDIRGKVPEELNEEMAYRIGRAFVDIFKAKKVVVGNDIRLSGPAFKSAVIKGLTEVGCDVVDIGMCGTEQIYFATAHLKLDGGIMITASHNPKDYNGMKLVRSESRPISSDSGLKEIEEQVVTGEFAPVRDITPGTVTHVNIMRDYVAHLLTYVDRTALAPLKVVVNAGSAIAGINHHLQRCQGSPVHIGK